MHGVSILLCYCSENITLIVEFYRVLQLKVMEGFFFANHDEREYDILTNRLPNGEFIKLVELPRSKKIAIVRKLTEKEFDSCIQLTNNVHNALTLVLTLACTFDDKGVSIDEIEQMHIKDHFVLVFAYSQLNNHDKLLYE